MENKETILVTGATGFVAGHCIEVLLKEGYKVRGTVRSIQNKEKNQHLLDMVNSQNLELVEADLIKSDDQQWSKIVENCDYVMHTASPFPLATPKNPDEIIKPAVQGTESVIKAAINNKQIKKVVLTSSVAAIFPGNKKQFLTSQDWSVVEKSSAYEASKHLAEKKAWELIEEAQKNGRNLPMTTINPGFIIGPCHTIKNIGTSIEFIINIMTDKIPGLAKVSLPFIDVREVALAHFRALFTPRSDGKRYILCEKTYWFEDISLMLQDEFSDFKYKITKNVFGSCTLGIAAIFNEEAKFAKKNYGKYVQFENSETTLDLGIQFRSARETLLDAVYDLIDKKALPNKIPKDHVMTHRTFKHKKSFDFK